MDVEKCHPIWVADHFLLKGQKPYVFFKSKVLGNRFQHQDTENKYGKKRNYFNDFYTPGFCHGLMGYDKILNPAQYSVFQNFPDLVFQIINAFKLFQIRIFPRFSALQ